MAERSNPSETYFEALRNARNQESLTDTLCQLIDTITELINRQRTESALESLSKTKQLFVQLRPVLDGKEAHRDHVEIMLLRKQLYELMLAVAQEKGDLALVTSIEEALREPNTWLALTVSDCGGEA